MRAIVTLNLIYIDRWLYWIQNCTIFRSSLNGANRTIFIKAESRISSLTINYVTNKLYWAVQRDSEGSIWESRLDGSLNRMLFSHQSFIPFQIEIVRNYILATTPSSLGYVLINSEDRSMRLIELSSDVYFGVCVTSKLRKPSKGVNSIMYMFMHNYYYCCYRNIFLP